MDTSEISWDRFTSKAFIINCRDVIFAHLGADFGGELELEGKPLVHLVAQSLASATSSFHRIKLEFTVCSGRRTPACSSSADSGPEAIARALRDTEKRGRSGRQS